MPVFFVLAARMNTCQLAQIPLLPNKFYRSILAFLASQRSAQARPHPMPCAINLPLAARSHARGMFAAQIPIAKPAARPTERPSRDFVPWRFSDAGCRSAWLDRRTPASENLHMSRHMQCSKGASYSITSSARSKIDVGTSRPSALAVLTLTTVSNFTGT
jgi:hypothetical protein